MANLYALMKQSLEVQEKHLRDIQNHLISMPEGSLYQIVKATKRYFYQNIFRAGTRRQIYLGKEHGEQAQLIADLKRKRFLLGCKKVLEGNVEALRACLLKYKEFYPSEISSQLAATYENIADVKICQTAQPAKADWQHAPYTRAEMYEENLKHEAIGGLWVRSKSEALIAFALDLAHVPFHYEELLEVEDKKIAPDFTILHPNTGEKVYWEHFGMMDDSAYATETFRKLIIYGRNGIIPGKNLIYTIETTAEPLSILVVQRMIRQFFLE